MLLSFIVPVYNNAAAFAQCRRSLLPLVESGIAEIVAVDDGSVAPLVPDGHGVRLLRTDHRGAAAARNAGIETAKGEFVWFVDADDIVVMDGIECLIDDLRSMPEWVPMMHIGRMVIQSSPQEKPAAGVPDASATLCCRPLSLVRPRSSIADHTTNIVRRSWLMEHSELRYPEDMSILEDTVFALRVVESAGQCMCNDTYRFYCHRTFNQSTTAGAWSAERSGRFMGDICRFFVFLRSYADRHSAFAAVGRFFERMRYVYLRVAMVKGCPRRDLDRLVSVVGRPSPCPMWFYLFVAFLCRTFRQKR